MTGLCFHRLCFEDLFNHRIQQLLHNYPLDKLTQSGMPFWSGAKKPPKSLTFDASDATHLDFVLAAAEMRCKMYNISLPRADPGSTGNHEFLREMARKVALSVAPVPFRPSEAVRYALVEEEEEKERQKNKQAGAAGHDASVGEPPAKRANGSAAPVDQLDLDCKPLFDALVPVVGSALQKPSIATHAHAALLSPVDFEKDDDAHMRVVAACANLRARNYGIVPEADLHTARGIAGKITPAISTSTAFAAGAICLEMYKILMPRCGYVPETTATARDSTFATSKYAGVDVASLSNTFSNLAVPLFATMQPEPPKAKRSVRSGRPYSFTPWDRIDVDGAVATGSGVVQPLTLRSLIALLRREHGLRLLMLSCGVSMLYSDFMNRKKAEERMDCTLCDLIETVSKRALSPQQKYLVLEVIAEDVESEEQIDLPYVRVKLR
jgi:ubiquitin-activating enzyme E1